MPNDIIDASERGKQASIDGFAHEHIVVGILMKKYKNVSLVDLPLSPYDIIIVKTNKENEETIIRAQVKTANKSISFTGGTRGGKDRTYKSDVKKYRQSILTSDVIIGIKPLQDDAFDLFIVPTILITKLNQDSISLNKISVLRNNYALLDECKNETYVLGFAQKHKLL